jgi:hypothetical protein
MEAEESLQEEAVKFADIQNILTELQETLEMVQKRTTLLGKRIRSEVEEEDLKAALAATERLEKVYLATAADGRQMPCWFEYVATQPENIKIDSQPPNN